MRLPIPRSLRPLALSALLVVVGGAAWSGISPALGEVPQERAIRPDGLTADPARPEFEGLAVDPDGRPITGVRVELRSGDRLESAAFTGPDGAFRLRARTEVGSFSIRAERLGYRTLERALTAAEATGERVGLVLEPAPLPLPGFNVEATSEACPARHHPDAASLWEAMARRHPGGLDTLGAATYTLARTDTLATRATNRPTPEGLSAGQRGFSGRLRLSWERRIPREGYAFPVRRTDPTGSYDAWSYAPLEADFASHFGTPLFVQQHRLRAPSPGTGGGWILAFCSADPERPGLDGHLELSPDTLLVRAEWRFRTPEPDEEAGGWARFPGTRPSGEPGYLLPLESLVWKTLREGRVQRRAQWYEAWRVTPGDSVPFLPERGQVQDPERIPQGGPAQDLQRGLDQPRPGR
jgi:hypothetical protein